MLSSRNNNRNYWVTVPLLNEIKAEIRSLCGIKNTHIVQQNVSLTAEIFILH